MRGVLTFLLVTVLAVPTRAQADKFVPHKNVPGPPRLDMEKADNSGAVNADVQFIADRQAIINHHQACYNFFSKPRHVRGSDGHGRCAHQRFRSVRELSIFFAGTSSPCGDPCKAKLKSRR